MKTYLISVTCGIALLFSGPVSAQDKKAAESGDKPKVAASEASPDKPNSATDELEAKFKTMMTEATMAGRWCSIKDGALGPEREDKYTIIGVTKLGGDFWIINARIEYNKKSIVAPIPVQVRWAGDTPVLIVEKIPMPGGGTYSARVLIYEHTYAGTWTGGDHGGLLNGIITNGKLDKPSEAK